METQNICKNWSPTKQLDLITWWWSDEVMKETTDLQDWLLFSKSPLNCIDPEDWRTVHASPIYKKGQRYTPASYRPVSLMCISSTLLEHIIISNIMDHADKNNILCPLQHGFRAERSCESQLFSFTDDVSKNLYNAWVNKQMFLWWTFQRPLTRLTTIYYA